MEEKLREERNKERNKRRKYRLLILFLILLGTGTMLATSTYAWFTSNTNVSVETLKVNIAAQNGIQISVDGTKWKSIIQKSDIIGAHKGNYAAAVNQIPETLEPVSTAGIPDTNGYLPMYYGVVTTSTSPQNNGEYILTATKTTEIDNSERTEAEQDTAKFIAFDLFFKVDEDTEVFLVSGSGATTTDQTDTGIKNASRIAFVNKGNTSVGSELATIQGLNAGASSTVTIWEQNYDVHTAAGVAHAKDVYGITTSQTGGSALAYSGVIAPISASDDILWGNATEEKHSAKFKTVTPAKTTKAGFTDYVSLFTLTKGITKMRIYMWVEGQDVDCENNASGGSISFDLKISTVNPGAGAGA